MTAWPILTGDTCDEPVMKNSPSVFCRKATNLYIMVMSSVFVLFTGPEGYILLEWKKCVFFAAATVSWLFVLTCGIFPGCGKRFFHRHYKIQDILLPAFILACVISTLASSKPLFLPKSDGRYNALLIYCLYGLVVLATAHFGSAERPALYAFVIAYSICCFIAIIQLLGYNPLGLFPNRLNYYDPFVQEIAPFLGTVGNIDLLSALHCLAVPMSAAYLILGHGRGRALFLIPLCLGLGCMFWVRVASGIVALLSTAILFSAFLPSLLNQRYGCFSGMDERRRFLAGIIPAAVLLIGILTLLRIYPFSRGTVSELHRLMNGQVLDEFGSGRIAIWRNVLQVIGERPVLGAGPGSLGDVLTVRFDRYSQSLGFLVEQGVDDAHNEYLHHMASFGLLGCIPLFLLQLRTAFLYVKTRAYRRTRCVVLAAGCFCYMVQAFFNISSCITTPLVCIVWGLLLRALCEQAPGNMTA